MKPIRLIAGLGNPGDTYKMTRHNIGFMVADELADTFSISYGGKKFDARFGRGHIENEAVILVKPMAFMNRSGLPVYNISKYFRISCEDMLIIHDDIDLAFGRIKIKKKGGHGGHNGVRSLTDAFGGGHFTRIRIGVGRSETRKNVADYVLSRFSADESNMLEQIIATARDAVVTILCKGTKEGMNRFNGKNII